MRKETPTIRAEKLIALSKRVRALEGYTREPTICAPACSAADLRAALSILIEAGAFYVVLGNTFGDSCQRSALTPLRDALLRYGFTNDDFAAARATDAAGDSRRLRVLDPTVRSLR